MFQAFHATGRRVRLQRRSTLLLSGAVHLAVLVGLAHLPPPEPRAPRWEAEPIAYFETAPAPPPLAPPLAPPPRPSGPAAGPAAAGRTTPAPDVDPPPPDRVPAEIPPVEARLSIGATPADDHPAPGARRGSREGAAAGLVLETLAAMSTPGRRFTYDDPNEPFDYPRLRNRELIVSMLTRLYPRRLQYASLPGSVTVRFVIDARGRVDRTTIRLIDFDQAEFGPVALRVVERFRFWPARYRDEPVPILIEMPIRWVPG